MTEVAPRSVVSNKTVEEIGVVEAHLAEQPRRRIGQDAPTLASKLEAEKKAAKTKATKKRAPASPPTRSARAPKKAASSPSRSSRAGSPRKAHPLHVVDLAELRRQRPADVVHQVEVDALLDQRVAGAKEVFDRVERLDDLRIEPGLFLHLAQRRLLRRLALRRRRPSADPSASRPRVAIMATNGAPSRRSMTAPPDECSLRVFRRASGIRRFYFLTVSRAIAAMQREPLPFVFFKSKT